MPQSRARWSCKAWTPGRPALRLPAPRTAATARDGTGTPDVISNSPEDGSAARCASSGIPEPQTFGESPAPWPDGESSAPAAFLASGAPSATDSPPASLSVDASRSRATLTPAADSAPGFRRDMEATLGNPHPRRHPARGVCGNTRVIRVISRHRASIPYGGARPDPVVTSASNRENFAGWGQP